MAISIKKVLRICIFGLVLSEFSAGSVDKPKLPSFLKICPKSDPNIKECLIESIEQLRPLMVKGIPDFGIPSCEPLIIPEVVIDQGNGPVAIKSTYRDIQVFGPSKFLIKNIKIDLDKDRVKIKIFIPEMQINTNYSMEGQILLMPIRGSGLSFGNYTNIDATISMKAERISRDSEIYYNIKDCYIDFNIGHAKLKFENLFNGNQELGDGMNLFLNDNWKTVANEIKPVIEDKLADMFKKFSNKIFHKYPLSMLFPE